jgi:hypothetical protein
LVGGAALVLAKFHVLINSYGSTGLGMPGTLAVKDGLDGQRERY